MNTCIHQMIVTCVAKCTNFLTAISCPSGKTFQQCGPLCPQTCNSSTACNSSGCAEGCFCPDDQVENRDGLCVDRGDCLGT